ncbi:Deoxyuridine 5'-triphosphate nucleotidohydrolase [Astathelohania contejeani]|uniref:Deoxyuridine 5'-triphosphate nucleotidohydrolase n=1 Tax=Astathelohania contejeani TaxID=164912 RepID=A0ABQ7HWU6_9MICR|nr:Deoxyuridine 5'-triphosphate nucleotidohydrolase [Thelohania contejeani]
MSEKFNDQLKYKKLTKNAFDLRRWSQFAAGYDLASAYDVIIPAEGKLLIKTDIQLELPEGCYGRIAPRSSLAFKHHINVAAGVIDRDYRGNVRVLLFNHSKIDYKVKRGDRIAQLICEKILYPNLLEVEQLAPSERGEGGFGSTGINQNY